MAKIEAQSSWLSTRSSQVAGDGVLTEDDLPQYGRSELNDSEDEFYRPAEAKKIRAVKVDPGFPPAPANGASSLDDDEPFLRSRRRVPVRKSILPRGRWGRAGVAVGVLVLLALIAWLGRGVQNFLDHDPRFRIDSSENIQILGNAQVTRAELLSVFGSDIGRNVFFIPLGKRRSELERLPWVEQATVMRLLPDQLRVTIEERTPIAFVRTGNEIGLVDHDGVLLSMDPKMVARKHFSFPVVTGIVTTDPASTRATRMKLYQRFVSELDSSGERVSEQLSEVDLSDPEDVKAVVPAEGMDILLHFGDQDFLERYRNYQQHLAEWKQQYPHLASVDLRYERQVVLEMQKGTVTGPNQDASGKTSNDLKAEATSLSPMAAKQVAASAARVKKHVPAHVWRRGRN